MHVSTGNFPKKYGTILVSCQNALNFIDDVIVFGETEKDHNESLKQVLDTFRDRNNLLNEGKCVWKAQELQFLGHILSAAGIRPDPTKVETILNFRVLTSKEETRSFLGLDLFGKVYT